METILSGLLGIMVGGAGVGIYFFRKNSELYSQVLDKQTIIKLIKDHMAIADKPKPRRNYRRKTNKSTVNKTTKKVV
tara:strand:- start:162 stop:392 length:231 start_codon:yes stop_codon:yes gene_type:complete